MTNSVRRALRLALPATLALPLAAAAVAAPAGPPSGIIPLPLNPVIPTSQRACGQKLPSGLGYAELRPASGGKPGNADVALINYIGYLAASGETFDQAMQAAMPVEGVIAGFSEGLKLMPKGSVYRFCIPAALGYGNTASGPIPAGSDLVFQVELLDYRSMAELQAAQAAQGKAAAPVQ